MSTYFLLSGRVAEKEVKVAGYTLAIASVILKQQLMLGDSSRQVSSQAIQLKWKMDSYNTECVEKIQVEHSKQLAGQRK